jgi:hypothetical protein
MTEVFIYSLAICTIFFLFKFLEMKFVPDDEKKPLKIIIKETLVVYFASIIGIYLYSQFDIPSLSSKDSPEEFMSKTAMAFLDNPTF